MITVSPRLRRNALHIAILLTSNAASPEAVMTTATPLTDWLAAAAGPGDQESRMAALDCHYSGVLKAGRKARQHLMDAPGQFIAEARLLYAYMADDAPEPVATGPEVTT
jgi:hypothetical protein